MSCWRLKPRIMSRVPLLTSNSPISSAGASPAPMSLMTVSIDESPALLKASSYRNAISGRENCRCTSDISKPRNHLEQSLKHLKGLQIRAPR